MVDAQLIDEFIRIEKDNSEIGIMVCEISWPEVHTPSSAWELGKTLDHAASDTKIHEAIQILLRRKKYFRVCTECKERNPSGWMHDNKICQSCAERNHGVCY